ncbi:hypothetical protein Tco_1035477 [Tanacetum coccineum]
MSNTNNNLQTQTSNALYNAIMEVGGKDHPPMLAPGNYVQWKSRIKRYIDTKPNNELIHYCLQNPLYKFKWTEKTVPVDQLNAKVEAVHIILTRIDNDIYSTVDAYLNTRKMWKAIERFVTLVKQSQELKTVSYYKLYDILKQHQNEVNEIRAKRLARTTIPLALITTNYYQNRVKAIINSPPPTYDQEPTMVAEDDEMSKEKKIDKLMALISLSFKKIYKHTNNNLRTSSNTSRVDQDNTPRINRGTRYDNQRAFNVAGARENVGTQIQEVTPNAFDNLRPIFDTEPLQKVQNNNDNYNVFSNDREHPEQPESINDTYLREQGDTNITINSMDMCNNGETVDQDDDDLAKERDFLASLIEKLKCEIDDSKNHNKFLESSNKALVDKLNGEIEDFKPK